MITLQRNFVRVLTHSPQVRVGASAASTSASGKVKAIKTVPKKASKKAVTPKVPITPALEEKTQINEFSNECRSLIVSGVAIPIYVTDSYASIKTILDGIDCNDLCSDS